MTESAPAGALAGIKIVDATRNLSGPLATMVLADLGAEVVKIENPVGGDDTRSWGPPIIDQAGPTFLAYNRNKRSEAVDLRTQCGQDRVVELVADADVFVENFRAGKMAEYGLGYERLSGVNPRLVYASISGYGQTGAWSNRPAMDLLVQASSGLMGLTGPVGGGAFKAAAPVADVVTGLSAAIAILGALGDRERAGGKFLDISMLESMLLLQGQAVAIWGMTGQAPARLGNGHPLMAPYDVYEAADGAFAVAVVNNATWLRFTTIPELADLRTDLLDTVEKRNAAREQLDAQLNRVFATRGRDYWIDALQDADVACEAIRSLGEAIEYVRDERPAESGISDVEYPPGSGRTYPIASGPWGGVTGHRGSPPSFPHTA